MQNIMYAIIQHYYAFNSFIDLPVAHLLYLELLTRDAHPWVEIGPRKQGEDKLHYEAPPHQIESLNAETVSNHDGQQRIAISQDHFFPHQ